MTSFPSLREFIDTLDRAGELVRISEPVSPRLEIAAVADQVMKQSGGGKALLFEKPAGHEIPVLVNAYGSRRRMAMALGVGEVEEIPRRIQRFLDIVPPRGVSDLLGLLPRLLELKGVPPRRYRGHPPCQEVILRGDAVDLGRLPVLTCWPGDGGPFVTFPCVITRDPVTGRRNVGMYRLQVYDARTTGMHWHIHKDGSRTHHEHRKGGRRMEAAVAIGTDPVVTYCATAPLPPGVDEMMLAGFIRGRAVEMARCVTVDLEVPATAEIVLEGYVDPEETRVEGPFGDHTGYYSPADPYPVFHVTAITHRRDPVYFTTVVGVPPMEDAWLGWATERIFTPLLRTQFPEVVDMHLPPEGVFHNLAILSVDKHFPMQARRMFQGLWGAGQMGFTKILAALDPDVDVTHTGQAARALLDRTRVPESLTVTEGVLDALDHSGLGPLWGGKLGIDATLPMPGEPGHGEDLSPTDPAPEPEDVVARLRDRFPELRDCRIPVPGARLTLALLVLGKGRDGEGAELAAAALEVPGIDVAVTVGGHADEPLSTLCWRALAGIEPVRDLVIRGEKVAIDATAKSPGEGHDRQWPLEVAHPPEILQTVEAVLRGHGLLNAGDG